MNTVYLYNIQPGIFGNIICERTLLPYPCINSGQTFSRSIPNTSIKCNYQVLVGVAQEVNLWECVLYTTQPNYIVVILVSLFSFWYILVLRGENIDDYT